MRCIARSSLRYDITVFLLCIFYILISVRCNKVAIKYDVNKLHH